MVNLDDISEIVESQGGDTVLKSVDALTNQLEQSYEEAQLVSFPDAYKKAKNILVIGMGGSRFPPLIIKELFKTKITVPYVITDDYVLPGFVGKDTLVLLSSYSGTTEEVVYIASRAKERGALISGITSGGEIASFLKANNLPSYIFDPKYNPSKQPRIGFGYSVGSNAGLLQSLGFLKDETIGPAIKKLPALLSGFKINIPKEKNPAKQLAQKLFQKYPYYIVSEFLMGVGNAVANQTNETAKSISSFRVIPELNHHLMEGLKFPDKLHDIGMFVFFYSSLYSPQIQKRFKITKEVVEQNNIQAVWYELQGKDKVEQAFELMALGGYMTMYLAALYGQNPETIPYVDYFKKKLKEMK